MIPILYASTETVKQLVADQTNGLGRLADAITCKVQEDRNGAFTLSMTYPISGIHYADIVIGSCIKAKPNELADPQLFRIYHISKPLNGVVTIDAQHISYDLSKAVVKPFTAKGITAVTSGMISNMIGGSGFSFSSDITNGDSEFTNDHPQSFRALLGGQEGSVLDVFGGEYEFNNEKVILHAHRGSDNGVTIRYGKNLTSVQQDENIENTYTAVYPYVLNSDQETIAGDLQTVISTSEPKVLALDLSSEFQKTGTEETTPTAAEINAKAQEYIKANNIGVPKVSLDVSFVQLWQTEEYKDIAPLERVSLCDTVTVKYEKLGVDATAKVITTVYDVLAERYDSITLGDAKSSLASTIAAAPDRNEIQKQASSDLERAVTRATNLITGQKGGHVVIKSDANGKPQELLIMDTEDEATATKVWRWNLSGLGYSSKGINGEYGTAITQDGEIVADYITTGDLNAQVITTGTLKDRQGNNSWNLDTGELSLHAYETKTDASSKLSSANSHADSAASTAETNAKAYADTQIKVSAEGITADVSKTYETIEHANRTESMLTSSIQQQAGEIRLEVAKTAELTNLVINSDFSNPNDHMHGWKTYGKGLTTFEYVEDTDFRDGHAIKVTRTDTSSTDDPMYQDININSIFASGSKIYINEDVKVLQCADAASFDVAMYVQYDDGTVKYVKNTVKYELNKIVHVHTSFSIDTTKKIKFIAPRPIYNGEKNPSVYEINNILVVIGQNQPASEAWTNKPDNDLISRINLAPSGIKIEGEKVDIKGITTYSSNSDGTTVIDGGKVTLQNLDAGSITTGTLKSLTIDTPTLKNLKSINGTSINATGDVTIYNWDGNMIKFSFQNGIVTGWSYTGGSRKGMVNQANLKVINDYVYATKWYDGAGNIVSGTALVAVYNGLLFASGQI